MPEWLKGTDCKSVGYAYVGSNPTPPTVRLRPHVYHCLASPVICCRLHVVAAFDPSTELAQASRVGGANLRWGGRRERSHAIN